MCDYSLHGVASRPAKIGDRLVTTEFRHTLTRGFSAIGEPAVAVCLLPGTEIAFDAEVRCQLTPLQAMLQVLFPKSARSIIHHQVGRFRQINMESRETHHDAIEFPDGQIVLLTRLEPDQVATVLQLPAQRNALGEVKGEPRAVTSAPTR